MGRYVEGWDRRQRFLLPECLEDYVCEDNPSRVMEASVYELDLGALGFERAVPAETGCPGYHPAVILKLYNRIPSSRRLEREAQRDVELMWLAMRLAPDFKTIADFRCDNGVAIRAVCRQFVMLCRDLGLFAHAVAAIGWQQVQGRQQSRSQLTATNHDLMRHDQMVLRVHRHLHVSMERRAKEAAGTDETTVLADRGYFNGEPQFRRGLRYRSGFSGASRTNRTQQDRARPVGGSSLVPIIQTGSRLVRIPTLIGKAGAKRLLRREAAFRFELPHEPLEFGVTPGRNRPFR